MNRFVVVRQLVKDPSLRITDIAKQTGYNKGHVSRLRKESIKHHKTEKQWVGLTDEELHLKAAGYANRRKEAYLDYVKKGEKLSEEMTGWIWVAHYEGYRDAIRERSKQ